ncbi:hypothetical protein MMC22_002458 [Lobaria immixta]|nr:hypothetical protein [Lobaria immixta]
MGMSYSIFQRSKTSSLSPRIYGSSIFQIPTVNQNLLILPTKFVDELKSLPETTMSSSQAVADYFLGSYTTLSIELFGHIVWDITRVHLTQNLGNLVEPLVDESKYGFSQEMPPCEAFRKASSIYEHLAVYRFFEPPPFSSIRLSLTPISSQDWTPIMVHPTFLEIVGRTSARIFVGFPLCRNPLWLSTSIDFARCIFLGSGILKIIPAPIRPLAALFNPHVWRIKRHHCNARSLLIPEILRRRELAGRAQSPEQWHAEKPNDMLQWIEEASTDADKQPERMVDRQLGMSFAAIHTTTNHLTNVIYDLAARWDQYGPELREEVEEALAADGGIWKKQTLTKLSKLDSFMKESQRINPPSALSFNRKIISPVSLTPEITLPPQSYIAVAAGPISADPPTFDGLRHHRLRSLPNSSPHSHQFVTTGLQSMTFGHGRFACPGRFFASNESKVVLAELLLTYDIRLRDGEERPKNLFFADACFPDPKREVLFRRRRMMVADDA